MGYGELYGELQEKIVLGLFLLCSFSCLANIGRCEQFLSKTQRSNTDRNHYSLLTATLDALKEGRNQDLYNQLQYLKKQLELRNPYEVDNSLNNFIKEVIRDLSDRPTRRSSGRGHHQPAPLTFNVEAVEKPLSSEIRGNEEKMDHIDGPGRTILSVAMCFPTLNSEFGITDWGFFYRLVGQG
jgi:hypothetical protein